MDEFATETTAVKPKAGTPPSFGIWLSLLAVGLTLNLVSSFAAVFGVLASTEPVEGAWLDVVLDVIIAGWCLTCLILLLSRRRRFIPAMISLLAVNMVILLLFNGYAAIWPQSAEERQIAILGLVGQTAISALWITFLVRSKHVRSVCVN